VPSTNPTVAAERRVELVSPFPPHAWPRVWTWLEPFRSRVLDDLSPQTRQAYVEQQLALAKLPYYRSWGVMREGELGGLIALLQPRGPADPSAIAHLVLRPEFYGFATSVPAIRQAFGQAFADGPIGLIRGEIFEDNWSIRSLVLEVGARLYGVLGRTKGKGRFAVEALPGAALRRGKYAGVIGFIITPDDLREPAPPPREAVSGPARPTPAAVPPPSAAPGREDPQPRPVPGLPGPAAGEAA
jgi:hypothetical protein